MRCALLPLLALAAAVPAADYPYNALIELDSANKSEVRFTGLALITGSGTVLEASWRGERSGTLASARIAAPAGEWSQAVFTATPDRDGRIALIFKGPWVQRAPDPAQPEAKPGIEEIWVDVDQVSVEGAGLENGDFELQNPRNPARPAGWWMHVQAERRSDAGQAQSGSAYMHIWNHAPVAQELSVTAGVPVVVTCWFRATVSAAPR